MGLTVEGFWALTPRELAATFAAAGWRREREQARDLWLAWHVAALGRARKMPPLHRLLNPPKTKRLTPEERARRAAEFEELKGRMGHGRK